MKLFLPQMRVFLLTRDREREREKEAVGRSQKNVGVVFIIR